MSGPAEQRVDAFCPACREKGILLRTAHHEVPFFGETLETTVLCGACGFRHTDFMAVGTREPVRFTIPIEPATLDARVVRAGSGTWRIPELGFAAEPTALSESFVTNVEGMLDRARDVVLAAMQIHADDDTRLVVAERKLEQIGRIAEGAERATLVLEDPFGASAIAHPRAARSVLTPEEADALQSGYVVLDAADLR